MNGSRTKRATLPGAGEIRVAVERFLANSRRPALLEPGEEILPLRRGEFALELRGGRLTFQAWDQQRNLVRRLTGIARESAGRLELTIERFGKREGRMFLLDQARAASQELERRGARLVFREQFRLLLRRLFPDWTLAELSTEPNLEASLSPVYPRALLRRGQSGWAAIGAAPELTDADGILSFGLIWLNYLRRRERSLAIEGLLLFLPAGRERVTALRLQFLSRHAARFELFRYDEYGDAARLDPRDCGNLETALETCRRPSTEIPDDLMRVPGVERIDKNNGSASLRVRGLEFARSAGPELLFGLAQRAAARPDNLAEAAQLAREIGRFRSPAARDRGHPLYRQDPEAWLESAVRAHLETVDPALFTTPVYGQVPAFAGGDRGVLDLLAAERDGRLVVIELKASADLHLPLQALDYWMRVKWHLDREEFTPKGYFPGLALRREAPRLVLLSPALEFHPTTEVILSFFKPAIAVERVGVGLEWRKRLEVVFRARGAERPL